MTRDEIEEAVVRAFFVPSRRQTTIDGLRRPKRRAKLLDRLHHHIDDLDARWRHGLPADGDSPAHVEALLLERGAPGVCYVISSLGDLDRKEMGLRAALNAVIGCGMGTILSCVHGKLGFYESEERRERYLLARP